MKAISTLPYEYISRQFDCSDPEQTREAERFALQLGAVGHVVRVEWTYTTWCSVYTTPRTSRYGRALCPTCCGWASPDGCLNGACKDGRRNFTEMRARAVA